MLCPGVLGCQQRASGVAKPGRRKRVPELNAYKDTIIVRLLNSCETTGINQSVLTSRNLAG